MKAPKRYQAQPEPIADRRTDKGLSYWVIDTRAGDVARAEAGYELWGLTKTAATRAAKRLNDAAHDTSTSA